MQRSSGTNGWAWALGASWAGLLLVLALAPSGPLRIIETIATWGTEEWSAAGTWAAALFTGAAFMAAFLQLSQQREALRTSLDEQAAQIQLTRHQLRVMAAALEPAFAASKAYVLMQQDAPQEDGNGGILQLVIELVNTGGDAFSVEIIVDLPITLYSLIDREPRGPVTIVRTNFGEKPHSVSLSLRRPQYDQRKASELTGIPRTLTIRFLDGAHRLHVRRFAFQVPDKTILVGNRIDLHLVPTD